jgi:hypothetical protein
VNATSGEHLPEEDLAGEVARHGKKRARLSEDDDHVNQVSGTTQKERDAEEEMMALLQDPTVPETRTPAFTIFTGPEEQSYDDGPPNQHLPHIFAHSPAESSHTPNGGNPMTATAFATENQPQFNFGLNAPMTSTPGPVMSTSNAYTYLEEPQSPTPAAGTLAPGASLIPSGSNYGHTIERAGGRRERNDLFHPYGTPVSQRVGLQADTDTSQHGGSRVGSVGVNPALILQSGSASTPKRELSSTDVGVSFGMSDIASSTPALPRKTMYGTELEGDTRFGDFGVEGVATGFWAGGRY